MSPTYIILREGWLVVWLYVGFHQGGTENLRVTYDPTIYTGTWMSPTYRLLSDTYDRNIYKGT